MGSMIVTIHQPEHLPWLGFFNKVDRADTLILLDTVQYRKNYFQNRNRVLMSGDPLWLTVPVATKGHTGRSIREMMIDNRTAWRRKHKETLLQAYGGHPFFDEHRGFFSQIYGQEWVGLSELNEHLIQYLLDHLGIAPKVFRSSDLGASGGKSELLLELCTKVGATIYLSGTSGREYLDERPFERAGVEVAYHTFKHPVYPQLGAGRFVSHLSAIDLLFNLGPDSLAVIREGSASAS